MIATLQELLLEAMKQRDAAEQHLAEAKAQLAARPLEHAVSRSFATLDTELDLFA